MAAIDLVAATKAYAGGVTAVDRLTLSVTEGELVVLVGPSGCGKSTTLRMIAGLERPTAGDINIGGTRVNEVAPKDRNVAMVFQSFALYPHMTVYKNMAFGLHLRQGGNRFVRAATRLLRPASRNELAAIEREIDARVRDTAQLLGLSDLLHRYPSQLSGGERQRTALGRAIVRQPAAFLFDEPLSNLDAQLRVEMRRELKALHRRLRATMLYVTHDQVEAMTLADRLAVLEKGVLQQTGTPQEVYDWPVNRFVAGFLGSPAINLLPGWLESRDGVLHFVGAGGALPVDKPAVERVKHYVGQAVQLGVRPEDVRLGAVAGSGEAQATLSAGVAAVETLGDALVLQLDLCFDGNLHASGLPESGGPASVLCKAPARSRASVGDRVTIGIDMRRAHLFDPATGANVSRPVRAEGN